MISEQKKMLNTQPEIQILKGLFHIGGYVGGIFRVDDEAVNLIPGIYTRVRLGEKGMPTIRHNGATC